MDNLINALNFLNASDLSYQEWVTVGMALHAENYSVEVWDEWSQADSRYHNGECQKKWRSFGGGGNQVAGGTIVQMAKDRGWDGRIVDGAMEWNDEIQYDGDDFTYYTISNDWNPVDQLVRYLRILFDPDDRVSFVPDAHQGDDGKWRPSSTGYDDRTAAELIADLERQSDDIEKTITTIRPEAGAWIRFNPVDGNGVKNENVTKFRYALVESDNIPIAEQDAIYRKLELPIAVMVHSGGKSLHAIVRVDAPDYEEYNKRVSFLYDILDQNQCTIDRQNRNPSRLSRMPGVVRNGNRQYIVAENIGRKNWADWREFVDGMTKDELPEFESLDSLMGDPPEMPEELITGILRRGHKMLVSGSSKAGKSFLLMELCIAIAGGSKWLGFDCKQGKVLYVNLEIDRASCVNRFKEIYRALGEDESDSGNITIWNLRGKAVPLDKLAPMLIRRIKDKDYAAVVIDPIYKIITGDENNASEMGAFCNWFDRICTDTGAAAIYCHHHSKGAQGAKRAMDRASGSGVFARDPDAQLDMVQLQLTDTLQNRVADNGATGWRLESSLREFANIRPLDFWFEYPIHVLDVGGELKKAEPEGSAIGNLQKSSKYTTEEERRDSVESAYEALSIEPPITLKDMAEYMGVTEKCARTRINESGICEVKRGFVYRK